MYLLRLTLFGMVNIRPPIYNRCYRQRSIFTFWTFLPVTWSLNSQYVPSAYAITSNLPYSAAFPFPSFHPLALQGQSPCLIKSLPLFRSLHLLSYLHASTPRDLAATHQGLSLKCKWSSGTVSNSQLSGRGFESHCWPFANNLEQVANLRCAQVNSASYPSRNAKRIVAYGLRGEGLV